MNPHERRVVGVVGGVVGVVLLALIISLIAGGGGDDDDSDRLSAGTSTSTSSTTPEDTTTSVVSSTTAAAPTTTRPAAVATTVAPTTTQLGPALTGDGAELRAPDSIDERTMSSETGCQSLTDVGWTSECGITRTRDAELAWLVESRPAGLSSARRAYVFRHVAADRWRVVLQSLDDAGNRYMSIRVAVVDVSGRGRDEIAFGFRHFGGGSVLGVDLVEGVGRVAVHRELNQGSARVSNGQLDTWSTEALDAVRHDVIRFVQGAWRVTSSSREPPPAPPSQL